jgi:hypothetical protein
LQSKASPGQKCETLSEIQLKQKRDEVMAQVVEHLPGKCKVLYPNPTTTKKNKINKEVGIFVSGV